MNIGIASKTSPFTKLRGKPPLYPSATNKSILKRKDDVFSLVNKTINIKDGNDPTTKTKKLTFEVPSSLPDSPLKAPKNSSQKTSLKPWAYTGTSKDETNEKKSTIPALDFLTKTTISVDKNASTTASPVSNSDITASISNKAKKKRVIGRHRRSNNVDFSPLLKAMAQFEALPMAFPPMDATTLSAEINMAVRGSAYFNKVSRSHHRDDPRRTILRAPQALSIEVRLDPLLRQQLYWVIRHAWVLLQQPSSCISDKFKANLHAVVESCIDQLRTDLETIRKRKLLLLQANNTSSKERATMVSTEQVVEWFTPCYVQAIARFQSIIGILQIFKRNKEFVGILQHGVGVVWAYARHTAQQNLRLQYVMIRWMYQHWQMRQLYHDHLPESVVERLAVEHDLDSVGVFEWWKNAVRIVVEPFEGMAIVPRDNMYGRHHQRRLRREARPLQSRA